MERQQQTGTALGSEVVLTLVGEGQLTSLFPKLWEHITTFEQRFSRFLPDSELTTFNNQAGREGAVSGEFLQVLREARHFSEVTGGLYNPFVLPALQKVGYHGSWPAPSEVQGGPDYTSRTVVPASLIDIGTGHATIPPNTALDFGGIGKGYLLDQLAQLVEKDCTGYWLSLGGDILCAGHDYDQSPWSIGIAKARTPEELVGVVVNETGRRQALATSGVTKRKGMQENEPWHHLIDPRTQQSARTDVLTATVVAETATAADVFAKCLVLVGASAAAEFVRQHGITTSIIQSTEDQLIVTGSSFQKV